MESSIWESSDERLFEELREAVAEARSIPDHVIEKAKGAFAWRGVDEELALLTLTFDSSLAQGSQVRGPAAVAPRILVFDNEDATMTLEVGDEVLMGQVVPAKPDEIVLEVADGSVEVTEADESGFFLLRRPVAGPVRLTWRTKDSSVLTQWVAL